MNRAHGFTLAELLIAIAIMGCILVFTIPKVLAFQNENTQRKFNAITKSVMAELSNSYTQFKLDNAPLPSTTAEEIFSVYSNNIKTEAVNYQLNYEDGSLMTCSASYRCLRFMNGAVFRYYKTQNFNGTTTQHAVYGYIDPDGEYKTNGNSASLMVFLYYDGRIKTASTIHPNTLSSYAGTIDPGDYPDPSWWGNFD